MNSDMCSGTFVEKIKSFYEAGFKGCELRVSSKDVDDCTKKFIDLKQAKELKKILNDLNLKVVSVFKLHGWFELDGKLMGVNDNWLEIYDECKKRMEIGKELNSDYIITCPSYSHRNHYATIEEGRERYLKLIELGKQIGISPTLEFMGQTKQINTLQKCLEFLNGLDEDLKIVADSYHFWRGGGNLKDIEQLNVKKISIVHIADADPNIKREIHKDTDRPMPTDGFLDLKKFLSYLVNYNNFYSVGSYKYFDQPSNYVAKIAFDKIKGLFNV